MSGSINPVEKAWAIRRFGVRDRNQRVEANQGLVWSEARRWQHKCREPLEDLIQEGNKGLIKAAERYTASKGTWSSYASRCIRSEIQHYLRDKGWGAVKPPRNWIETLSKIRTYRKNQQRLGRDLSEVQAAADLGISAGDLAQMVAARRRVGTIPEGFEVAAPEDEDCSMSVAVEKLSEPHKTCIVERFYHDVSFRKLAKRYGVKQIQVEAWVAEGLVQLREELATL